MSRRGNPNKRLSPEELKEKHAKNKTLIIEYDDFVPIRQGRFEGFKNVNDPERIISRRNAKRIKFVTYMGEPYDISKHLNTYSKKQTSDEIKKSEASEAGSKK